MSRSFDVLFTAEYIKNVLYFSVIKPGKVLQTTESTLYFCTDEELTYDNFYSDFGPLNIGCVYRFCKILNEKLKRHLNLQVIVYYTVNDPEKKANAAFLMGCYGVLYLNLQPWDAYKPLIFKGQTYKPFQDATPANSPFTISILDCLNAIKRARDVGFFNFQDFDIEDYERLDRIQGGDLNWIIPGKFLAFIGPVDLCFTLYHPPEMYISYFLDNDVKIVIRLNKSQYDANVFCNAGIMHYDLFFPDGTCPPRHILLKFLQISEEAKCAIAVHCKAGLGRTGSLIGCYLMKHYHMTAREAIAWMRICRPGSVIGQQQGWLEKMEPWLMKQGAFFRKRNYKDADKIPVHEYGIYSKSLKLSKSSAFVYSKTPSPPPPMKRQTRSELTSPVRPQASKQREDVIDIDEDNETFIVQCDLSVETEASMTKLKGSVIKRCKAPEETIATKKKPSDWHITLTSKNHMTNIRSQESQNSSNTPRRCTGSGDPRPIRISNCLSSPNAPKKNAPVSRPIQMPTFGASQVPMLKSVKDAKEFLMRSSIYGQEREKQHKAYNIALAPPRMISPENVSQAYPVMCTGSKTSKNRRKLGRSPSPPLRVPVEQTRATNTPPNTAANKRTSFATRIAFAEALSRLKRMFMFNPDYTY